MTGVPTSPTPPAPAIRVDGGTTLRAVEGLSRWSAMLVVLALLVSINIEVFSRYLFGRPTTWVTEFSAYFLVAITFLCAAFVQRSDRQVRVTLVRDALPAGLRALPAASDATARRRSGWNGRCAPARPN